MNALPTLRGRFLGALNYSPCGPLPNVKFGYWDETLDKWREEGLPSNLDVYEVEEYFGLEKCFPCYNRCEIDMNLRFEPFEEVVFWENEEKICKRGADGVVRIEFKKGRSSIPKYIEFPVKDRETWHEYRERYDVESISNPPMCQYFNEVYNLEEVEVHDIIHEFMLDGEPWSPVGVRAGGFFGWARSIMGLETLVKTFYTDPDLIREMFTFRREITLKWLREILPRFRFDFSHWWEDMCYNKGPLISPKLFKEYMVPEYKRITSYLEEYGVKLHILDSDGDVTELAPLWLEGGINCLFPCEIRGGSDPLKLREKCGRELRLMGGVDKIAVKKGEKATRKWLSYLLPLIREGGFIPFIDHRVPPDVPLMHYRKYLEMKVGYLRVAV